jgi:hypothetical protein
MVAPRCLVMGLTGCMTSLKGCCPFENVLESQMADAALAPNRFSRATL